MITLKSQREIEAMDRAGDFASIHIDYVTWSSQGLTYGK